MWCARVSHVWSTCAPRRAGSVRRHVPAARIEELTERYAEPAAFTDLLLLP